MDGRGERGGKHGFLTVFAHMQDAIALGATNAFSTELNKVNAQMRLSSTYDYGREMGAH